MGTPVTKRALITGVTGQLGSYLAELLLDKGYEVHGLLRRSSNFGSQQHIAHLYRDPTEEGCRFFLHHGDVCDASSVQAVVSKVRPDELYNLAAQSHVRVSFDLPEHTGDVVALGVTRVLEALRSAGLAKHTRVYQASSSEVFGDSPTPQNEDTPFRPRSPYAAAKAYGFHMARNYREAYGMHVSNGILFNSESPRRGETFVTRKITRAIGRIKYGLQNKVTLGALSPRRDWCDARDSVRAMWLMLQQSSPDDYVIGTEESHSVSEFAQTAFDMAGFGPCGWEPLVVQSPRLLRPAEVEHLQADASKARAILGWKPSSGPSASNTHGRCGNSAKTIR